MRKKLPFTLPYSLVSLSLLAIVVGVHLFATSEFEDMRLDLTSTGDLLTQTVQLAAESGDVWLARRLYAVADTHQERQVLGVNEEVELLLYPDRVWEGRLFIITTILTEQPSFVEAMVEKVVVLNHLGRVPEAQLVAAEVVKQDPNHPFREVLQKFAEAK